MQAWQMRGDFSKGYTVILDMFLCGAPGGLILLPRLVPRLVNAVRFSAMVPGESKRKLLLTAVSTAVATAITVAVFFLTPPRYNI